MEPLLSPDGQQLYIMSSGPAAKVEWIWVSDYVDGKWSSPTNLDAPINSAYADHCLYFSGDD